MSGSLLGTYISVLKSIKRREKVVGKHVREMHGLDTDSICLRISQFCVNA